SIQRRNCLLDESVLVPPLVVEVPLQLGVADEDVLVDQCQPQVPGVDASSIGLHPPHEVQPGRWSGTVRSLIRSAISRVEAPSSSPSGGTWPGVRDSFGITPGTSMGRSSRGSSTSTNACRARNCGSVTMSATLLMRLTGMCCSRSSTTTSSQFHVAVQSETTPASTSPL